MLTGPMNTLLEQDRNATRQLVRNGIGDDCSVEMVQLVDQVLAQTTFRTQDQTTLSVEELATPFLNPIGVRLPGSWL